MRSIIVILPFSNIAYHLKDKTPYGVSKSAEKLGHYEGMVDGDRTGLHVDLPCKVGDTVYRLAIDPLYDIREDIWNLKRLVRLYS